MSRPSLVQEKNSPPLLRHRCTSHIEDTIRQAVLETVWRADDRLPPASYGTIEQPVKQPVDKQKKLRYAKTLQKGDVRPSTLFYFDILAQLANIPARITLTNS